MHEYFWDALEIWAGHQVRLNHWTWTLTPSPRSPCTPFKRLLLRVGMQLPVFMTLPLQKQLEIFFWCFGCLCSTVPDSPWVLVGMTRIPTILNLFPWCSAMTCAPSQSCLGSRIVAENNFPIYPSVYVLHLRLSSQFGSWSSAGIVHAITCLYFIYLLNIFVYLVGASFWKSCWSARYFSSQSGPTHLFHNQNLTKFASLSSPKSRRSAPCQVGRT